MSDQQRSECNIASLTDFCFPVHFQFHSVIWPPNPELVPELVDILLELSRNGVQIFIATHSEILASYFAVNRQNGDKVILTVLYKDGEQIKANRSDRFDLLEPNNLKDEPVKLYEKKL